MGTVEVVHDYVAYFLQFGSVIAPILYISFHLIRSFIWIPATVACLIGGILFGPLYGMIYSLIGLTLQMMLFYVTARLMPKIVNRLLKIKERVFGTNYELSTRQISLLRLVPFIHYHLLSLCLYENAQNFKEFIKSSFLSNVPLVIMYTALGEILLNPSPIELILMVILLFVCFKSAGQLQARKKTKAIP